MTLKCVSACCGWLALVWISPALAHEEPPRLPREQRKQESERRHRLEQKIARVTAWRQPAARGETATLAADSEYDEAGRLARLRVFDEKGAVWLRFELGYDDAHRLLSQRVFRADGSLDARLAYRFDGAGLLLGYTEYDAQDQEVSRFDYIRPPGLPMLVAVKTVPAKGIEYQLAYLLGGRPEDPLEIGACRVQASGHADQCVWNDYDDKERRVRKRVYSVADRLSFSFLYAYDAQDRLTSIRKEMPDGTSTVTTFRRDAAGNSLGEEQADGEGRLTQRLEHRTERRK